MANEITPTGSLSFQKGFTGLQTLSVSGKTFNITGSNFAEGTQTIPTSATAIEVGNLANVGWFFIKNNDTVNPVDIMTSTSGSHMLQIQAGEFATGRFATAVTAPACISTGGSVQIQFLILEI